MRGPMNTLMDTTVGIPIRSKNGRRKRNTLCSHLCFRDKSTCQTPISWRSFTMILGISSTLKTERQAYSQTTKKVVTSQPFRGFFSNLLRTSSISLRMYGVTESTSSKHFFLGGYKAYCIKNIQFYTVQSIYCIKNLFPHHSNIRKHILISFIVRWGIFLLRPIIGSTDSHNLYWDRDIIKYPSS